MSDQDSELFQESAEGGADKPADGKPDASKGGTTTTEALALLVGEGRKYKTIEDLAKSYLKADEFIEVLKNDNAKLKQEAVKGKTLDEVLERIEQGSKSSGDTKPAVDGKSFTAADIERLVDERLTGRETARTREDNIRKAEKALVATYGEKSKEVYLAKADTPQKRKALNDLAAVDPVSFAALFQTTAVVGNPADGQTTRSDGITINTGTGRAIDPDCKEFYDAMRKKEPAKYYSQAVQSEMHKKLNSNPQKFLGRKVG
jgi:hypothetical protein